MEKGFEEKSFEGWRRVLHLWPFRRPGDPTRPHPSCALCPERTTFVKHRAGIAFN